ncbi:MAG: hypothetical protein JWP91_4422 [Fibrobacteres bacterium]|nr:hypothetical protein [Fibrobacterota bacterium]
MGNISAMLLILVFLVIGVTLAILFLAVLRETLFWYWRSKGVMQEPEDILNRPHETALIIRKSIAGMKTGEEPGAQHRKFLLSKAAASKIAAAEKGAPSHPGFSDPSL